MARALSTVKMAATLISNQLSRRGFAAVAQGVEATRRNVMAQTPAEKEPAPWIPDPVTGYYRPENAANPIDVAELREVLLNQNKNLKN